MSLQLPVFGGFYGSAGRGILTEEHHFSIRLERENVVLAEKRFRIYLNRLDVMHLTELI